jgi:hypothetical protein
VVFALDANIRPSYTVLTRRPAYSSIGGKASETKVSNCRQTETTLDAFQKSVSD